MSQAAASTPTQPLAQTPPLVLPRGLIFLAFLWLVGSWAQSIGFRTPLRPSPASYEPQVTMMLLLLMIGLLIGWPVYRLSQPRSPWPIRQIVLDLLVLLSMVQVVVWPLRLVTTWTRGRTTAMDLTLVLWAMIAGAIVVSAIGSPRRAPRIIAMTGCIVLCLAGPALAWIGSQFGVNLLDLIDLSPIMNIQQLGAGKGADPLHEEWMRIMVLLGAAVLGWGVALGMVSLRRRGAGHATAGEAHT